MTMRGKMEENNQKHMRQIKNNNKEMKKQKFMHVSYKVDVTLNSS
jgi:hypothetical protein